MRERLRVIAPYAVVLVLAGALYLVATRFEYTPHAGRLGPDLWPRTILILIAGVCLFRILTALRAPRDEGPGGGVLQDVLATAREGAPAGGDAQPGADARFPGLLALGIAITVAYVWLLGLLGFALASALYIGAMIRVGRYRRWRVIVPTALMGSLVFMFVFQKIVYLSLPIGQPPFDALSLALMRLMAIR
jgi:putative tricarboxylic transport membrane protein